MEKTNVKAYFSAREEDFSIEDFTNELGVEPTRTIKQGEAIKRPPNPNMTSTGKHYQQYTSWELGTDYEESLDINKQLYFSIPNSMEPILYSNRL